MSDQLAGGGTLIRQRPDWMDEGRDHHVNDDITRLGLCREGAVEQGGKRKSQVKNHLPERLASLGEGLGGGRFGSILPGAEYRDRGFLAFVSEIWMTLVRSCGIGFEAGKLVCRQKRGGEKRGRDERKIGVGIMMT